MHTTGGVMYSLGKIVLVSLLFVTGCTDPSARKQQYLEKGNQYFSEGKYSFAIIEYKNAVDIDATFGQARKKLAEAYAKNGDASGALQESVRAADLIPDDYDTQMMAGLYLLAARRHKDSLARADAALKLQPNDVQAMVLRGNALAGLTSFDDALKAIEGAIKLEPTRGATYASLGMVEMARGNRDEADAAFARAVALSPGTVDVHLARGNFLWATKRPREAEQSFLAALKVDPKNVSANRIMAALTFATGRQRETEPYLRRIAESSPNSDAALALTDYYVITGRPKEAVADLQKLSANHVPGASLRLAGAHAAAGDVAKAKMMVDAMIADNASDANAHMLKARILMTEGNRDGALTEAHAAATADASLAEAQFLLGRLYADRGDLAAAQTAFGNVLKINPRAAAAQVELGKVQLAMGKADASVRLAEEATRNSPQSLAARLTLVRGLMAAKNFARADQEISTLRKTYPDSVAVYVQASLLALLRNDAAGARAALDRAQVLDPSSTDLLTAWIAYDFQTKNLTGAKARIESRLKEGATSELLSLAAQTYMSVKDFPAAERSLRTAIEKDPSQLRPYAMLGQLYLSQQKLDQARAEFDAMAARQAKPVSALTMSGMILQTQGDTAQARQRYERALAIDSHAVIAANNLAWIQAESGENLDTALQLAQTATTASPDVPELMDTLGWVYYKKDLPKLAIPLFERCVEKAPTSALYHYHLGLAYLRAGDEPKGRNALEGALKAGPDRAMASEIRKVLDARSATTP